MGDTHDNSEYENPVSRTSAQPPPPETFPAEQTPDTPDSTALFREDIRSGMSDEEATERAEQRAAEAEGDAEGEKPKAKRKRAGS